MRIVVCLLWAVFSLLCYNIQEGSGQRGDVSADSGGNPLPLESSIDIHRCPTDITVTMQPCERSDVIEISWDEPSATSDGQNVRLVSQNIQSGSVFHGGEITTVEYVFENDDEARAYCRFDVSIIRAPSKCFITHGPHIVTFDGAHYEFLSDCMYTLVSSCGDTDLPEFEVMGDFLAASNDSATHSLRDVRLYYRSNEFVIRQGKELLVNGIKINYPLVDFDGVNIFWNPPNSVLIADFGLTIKYDGIRNAVVSLATSQTVCGLCGNNDFDQLNEQHDPQGQRLETVTDFIDAWASVTCGASSSLTPGCDNESPSKDNALEQCNPLYMQSEGPFSDCYLHVDEFPLYSSCLDSVCTFPLDTSVSCDYYNHFAQICGEAEVLPPAWRDKTECESSCPEGKVLSTCAPACPKTCAQPDGPTECDMPCMEACVCPSGMLLDGTECVLPEDCGCSLGTGEYIKQLQVWNSLDCTQQCYCDAPGELQCRNYTCNENAQCVVSDEGKTTCQCDEGLNGNGEICVADSGICQVWGDPHYLTFDGRKFTHQGLCYYTLVKPCDPSSDLPDFHLMGDNVRRRPADMVSYQGTLILQYRGHEYLIKADFVSLDGVRITLPLINHAGVSIHYDVPFTVLETEFGLGIHYNQRWSSDIYLSKDYASRVCGLCGNFDGNRRNEFYTPTGEKVKHRFDFVASWVVDGDSECAGRPPNNVTDPCELSDPGTMEQVNSLCQKLLPSDDRLGSCHEVVDATVFYDSCLYDLCATLPETFSLCDSIEEFLVKCREAGGDPGNWRNNVQQCPFDCPTGFSYNHCGVPCQNTCIERNRTASCEETCQETCQCPDGQLLDGDRCVDESQCGCLLEDGQYISRGDTWTSDSCTEVCTCQQGGHLECDYIHCHQHAQCVIKDSERKCVCNEGYMSYGSNCVPERGLCITWGHHHFLSYDGVAFDFRGNCAYTFIRSCGDLDNSLEEFHLTGDFDIIVPTRPAIGLRRIRLQYRGHEYLIESDRVLLDEVEVTLPLRVGGVHIYLRPVYTVMETDFGLKVVYNQNANFRMHLDSSYAGSVCGLCGNFDGESGNDFAMPNNQLNNDVFEFGNSWAVEDCTPVIPTPDPCDTRPNLQEYASDRCSAVLNTGNISFCLDLVDFEAFYEGCVSDLCFGHYDVQTICTSLEAYVASCQESAAVSSAWRSASPQCAFDCPVGMTYTSCGSGCPATCLEPESPASCNDTCVETCACPEGQLLDGTKCVTPDQCGCQMPNGLYVANGQSRMSEDCSELCSCEDRTLSCISYTCHSDAACDLRDGIIDCYCLEGFIGDGGYCRPATGICHVWGDSHHITFDGRKHHFQGACEYTLVEQLGLPGDLPGFGLYSTNLHPDSTQLGSIKRQIRLAYGDNNFTIGPGSTLQLNGVVISLPLRNYEGVNIYARLPDIILETDFGLSVTFNQKRRADVTLPAEYGGQIGGLCGDFDENSHNDLKQPDGTVTRSVNKFGNSWATNPEDCKIEEGIKPLSPCDDNPSLLAEAESLCAPLAPLEGLSAQCDIFGMEFFYESCLYDFCAEPFDFFYFCDIIQQYDEVCGANVGLRISPPCVDECPDGMMYTDCADPCPGTCADKGVQIDCSREGCIPACACPEGQVLDALTCVPREECGGCTLPIGVYITADSMYISPLCDKYCSCMDGELNCFDYDCDDYSVCTTIDGTHGCHCIDGYMGNGESCIQSTNTTHLKIIAEPTVNITNCPSNMEKTVPPCDGDMLVTWEEPTASRSDGSVIGMTAVNHQPGEMYRPGIYSNYYIYEEDSQNMMDCNFTITVKAALIVSPGHCGTPDDNVIQEGELYVCEDCTEECICTEDVLVCREISCSRNAECSVQAGERGCHCLDGFSGDGIECHRSDCPSGFYAFESSCYYMDLHSPRLSFDDARAFCQNMGADLPVVQDKAENDFLAEMNGQHLRSWLLAKRHPDRDYIMERSSPGLEYKFLADPLPHGANTFQFSVKAARNAHIIFSPTKSLEGKLYEFVIGSDMNTRSYLSLCAGCPRVANTQRYEDVLSQEDHQHFFFSISGRSVYFGRSMNQVSSGINFAYIDRGVPIDVKYVAFGTDGVDAEWAFYKTVSWLDGSDWTFENWRFTKPSTDPTEGYCIQLGYGCADLWTEGDCSTRAQVICEIQME